MTSTPANAGTSHRTAWFPNARFGMFIHWGLYSILGHGEWAMNRERIPLEDYVRLLEEFTAEKCDPSAWVALAKEAGMRYVVLTTKHHEGFCLWNSRLCSFNAVNSPAGRDIVREYVEAARAAGLKVGLYYSLGDWFNPDWALGWQGDSTAKDRFMDYTHGLVEELMTGYGKIDILWYDLPQCYSADEWNSVELNAKVRSLQPHILINNRAMTTEDFATPEQHAKASAPGRLWESCMTLNRNWGYVRSDMEFKSAAQVVRMLADISSGGGNLLLNVGPDGQGRVPEPCARILREVGAWLQTHGEAIYGTDRAGMNWNLWGGAGRRGNTIYLFLSQMYEQEITIGGLKPRVVSAELIGSKNELNFRREHTRTIIGGLPDQPPDSLLPVIKIELDGPPDQDTSEVIGGADIFPLFPP